MGRELGRRTAYRGGFDEIRRLERRRGRTCAIPLLAAVAAAASLQTSGVSMTLGCLRSSDVRLIQRNVRTQSKLALGARRRRICLSKISARSHLELRRW